MRIRNRLAPAHARWPGLPCEACRLRRDGYTMPIMLARRHRQPPTLRAQPAATTRKAASGPLSWSYISRGISPSCIASVPRYSSLAISADPLRKDPSERQSQRRHRSHRHGCNSRAGNTTRDNRHARGMNCPEHVAANKLCPHRRLLPWDLSNSVCTWPASWTQIRGRCMHRDCFDHREHKSIPEGPHALQFGYRLVQVRGGCSFSLEEGRRLHGNLDVLSQEGRETQGPEAGEYQDQLPRRGGFRRSGVSRGCEATLL